jgi:hypothetical protein
LIDIAVDSRAASSLSSSPPSRMHPAYPVIARFGSKLPFRRCGSIWVAQACFPPEAAEKT